MIATSYRARTRPAPLDLRFIDLFMAIILAVVFLALLLLIIAGTVPAEPPPASIVDQATRVAQLEAELKLQQERTNRAVADAQQLRNELVQQADTPVLPTWLMVSAAAMLLASIVVRYFVVVQRRRLRPGNQIVGLAGLAAALAGAVWGMRQLMNLPDRIVVAVDAWWWMFLTLAATVLVGVLLLMALVAQGLLEYTAARRGLRLTTVLEPL